MLLAFALRIYLLKQGKTCMIFWLKTITVI